MVKLEFGPYKFAMDGYLYQNMRLILDKAIPNKWDCVGIIFGKEGSGKSTLATQLAIFSDPSFDISRCCFTPKQFLEATDTAPEGSAILWDEAITGATAQQQGNEISQSIISRLTTIRRKRLKIFVCFPYLHMLNKYFISRCLFSVFVYAKAFDQRGYMKYYNQRKSEVLYELMKNKYTYSPLTSIRKVTPNFFCQFGETFCLPEGPYDDKKEKSTRAGTDALSKHEEKWKSRLITLCRHLKGNKMMNQTEMGAVIGLDKRNMTDFLKQEEPDTGAC